MVSGESLGVISLGKMSSNRASRMLSRQVLRFHRVEPPGTAVQPSCNRTAVAEQDQFAASANGLDRIRLFVYDPSPIVRGSPPTVAASPVTSKELSG